MRLKFYYSTFLFLILFCQGLLAQRTADFTFDQTVQNDTLYLDFKVKRTSVATYDLGGYNIVFKVDTSVVDTTNAKLFSQGFFGVKTTEYGPVRFIYLSANTYQLTLYKNLTATTSSTLPNAYVSAGKVGFKIKGCGPSNVTFTSPPFTTIVAWNGSAASVSETTINPASIPLSGKSNAKLVVSKDSVCKNGTVTFTSELKSTFSNYTLFSRSSTGVNTLVSGPQASNIFPNVAIPSASQFFVRFQNGTNVSCSDNTDTLKVVAVDPQPALTITPPAPPVCLGNILTIGSSSNDLKNKFTWKLIPSTLAQFVGASSGVGKNSVVVDFDGINPYSVQLSVQDTNKFGCVSPVSVITINAVKCDLSPDFTINGSDVGISSCQNAFVTFRDKSISSAGTIVKWSWEFGAGATPDTSNLKDPAPVMYSSAGIVNVKLTVTDNNGLSKTIVKSPTVRVLSVLSGTPNPSCGSSSCNEVNFNWQPIAEATSYAVKYKKGLKGSFSAFQNISLATSFKVTAASAGMGGSLEFSDTKNDTIYFQVRAIAGNCDSAVSNIVFCRPSFCSSSPGCSLPADSIPTPATACLGSTVKVTVFTTPKNFYAVSPFRSVRFVWDNGLYDTSHTYSVKITTADFQKVKLLTIDTLKPNCYSLKSISIPVGKTLTSKPDLGIQSLECDRVTFVWKHVEGALKYQIKYSGSCIGTTNFVDAPLNGQAEFFELTGLTNNCNIDFQVRAVGSCNITQSDTLISPPTCSCFIGHIASSNLKSCALDTVKLKISNIQAPNWMITWHDPVKNIDVSSKTDTTYNFIPDQPNKIYNIKYTIFDLSKPDSCKTVGFITDTTSNSTSPEWNPIKTSFCISDVIYYLNDKAVNPGYQYSGFGVDKLNDSYYFDPAKAGLGTHTIVYNACGNKESHDVKVVDKPCVTTVVGGGNLIKNPNDLYTACDGTIYITDENAIWRYLPTGVNGIPELVVQSPTSGDIDGNILAAMFGRPYGIVMDESTKNELYFADNDKHKIRRVVFDKSRIETVAGQNVVGNNPNNNTPKVPLASARFFNPNGLAMHPNQDTLYVSDATTNSIKSFTFKGLGPEIKLVLGNQSGSFLPGRGKSVNVRPRRIAVDSLGLSFTDEDGFIGRYQFKSDSANASSVLTPKGYKDGLPSQYLLRSVAGVTPRIGDWIFFTDRDNYALRRVNAVTGYMETVAGSPPSSGPPSNFPPLADGSAFDARFSVPTALSFNIKGYIDVLDAGSPAAVRRYYIPRWGLGTWDGFDSTYVKNCDSDTLSPNYSAGILRQISGKSNGLVSKTIFQPKDTGNYLLSYTIKVGRCDTTFFKNVYVREQPKPTLNNDTTCSPTALLSATAVRDTSVRYKWFGPDVRTLPLAGVTSDTNRTVSVSLTGKYWVEIYFGKKRKCFVTDSAAIKIINGQVGKINSDAPGNPADVVTLCYGGTTKLSMDELSTTAPKFTSFLWSTGETTRAITASGSAIYKVTARDLLGCDVIAQYKVLQQTLPGVCIKATDVTSGKSMGWGRYTVSTFAGRAGVSGSANGKGSLATFKAPWGLAIYKDTLYVSDKNNKIRSISLNDANVKDFLGTGSNSIVDSVSKNLAALNTPQGLRFDKFGNLYVANTGANNIAKFDRAKNLYYILAGSGTAFYADSIGKFADLNQPYDLEVDAAGNVIFTDNQNHAIRTIDSKRRVRTLAGNPPNLGSTDGKGRSASFNWPWGITTSPSGDLYIAEDANHTLRKLALDTTVKLVAGGFNTIGNASSVIGTSVPGLNARFNRPWNLTSDRSGNILITDAGNNLLRLLDTKGNVITIAGKQGITGNKDGAVDSATFSNITGVVVDPKTQSIYVADQNNNTIRKLTKNKTVYVCKGNLYSLADSCTNARTDLTVTWKKKAPNGTFVTQFSGAPTNQTDTATFVMEVKYKGNTCPDVITDTIRVRFHEADTTFRITAPNNGDLFCKGNSITLAATPGYAQYQWFTTSGSIELPLYTSPLSTSKTVLDVGVYKLLVYVPNKRTGCLDRLKAGAEKTIFVFDRLKANFRDSMLCLGNQTLFEPLDSDTATLSYKWDFGVLNRTDDTATTKRTFYEFPVSGNFNVRMVVSDPLASGLSCPDTITKQVTISSLPKLTLSLNGSLSDSIRSCGLATQNLSFAANFTPDVNTAAPYNFYWSHINTPGGLTAPVTPANTPTNTAAPVLAVSDYTSLFGYVVFVRDNKNCASNKDTVYARLSKTPVFSISVSKPKICVGQSTVLTAIDTTLPKGKSTDYSYKWFLAGQQINTDTFSTGSSLSVSPLLPTTYRLVVKNLVTGCSATFNSPFIDVIGFSVNIDPVPLPTPCTAPSPVPVSAKLTGNPVKPVVSWTNLATGNPSPAIPDPTKLDITVFNDSTRTLRVFVIDSTGCSNADTVIVQGTSKAVPKFGVINSPDSICRGQLATFTAYDSLLAPTTTGYTYVWDSAGVKVSTDDTNPVLQRRPGSSVSYRLTVKDKNSGCEKVANSALLKVNGFDLSIDPVNVIPCSPTIGEVLKPRFAGDTITPISFKWSDSSGTVARALVNPGSLNPTSMNDSTRVYKLFVKDKAGCFDSAYVKVQGTSLVRPRFGLMPIADSTLCRGVQVTLTPVDSSGSPANQFSYFWDSLGVQVNANTGNPVLIKRPVQTVKYTLRVVSKNSGCSKIVAAPLISVSGFTVKIDSIAPPVPCSNPVPVTLKGSTLSGNALKPVSVLWTDNKTGKVTAAINNSTDSTVLAQRDSTRIFEFRVTDAAGCSDSTLIKVQGTSRRFPKFGVIASASSICRGQLATFTAVDSLVPPDLTGYTYVWDSLGTKVSSNDNLAVFQRRPDFDVTYRLSVKDKNSGCVTTVQAPFLDVNGFNVSFDKIVVPACSPTGSGVQLNPIFSGDTITPITFKWSDSTGKAARALVNANILTPRSINDSTRVYKLFVKDNVGCFDSAFVKVPGTSLSKPRFSVSRSPSDTICKGLSVTFTPKDSSGSPVNQYNYFWDSSGVQLNHNAGVPVLISKPQQSADYTLRVRSINSGCVATVLAPRVNVKGFIVRIDSVAKPVPCTNPVPVPLTGTTTAKQPFTSLWTDVPGGKIAASITNPWQMLTQASGDSTRTYKLKVRDASGCVDSSYIKVQGTSILKPLFSVTASDAGPICRGKEVTYTATDLRTPSKPGDYTYRYDSSGFQVNSDITNPVLKKSPQNTVQYSLRVTSKHSGCDTVLILPVLNVNGFDITTRLLTPLIPCAAPDPADIEATTNAVGIKNIQWTDAVTGLPSSALTNPNQLKATVFRDTTRTFKISITDNQDCIGTGLITVKANSKSAPIFNVVTGRDTGVCVGSSVPVRLAVIKGDEPYNFTWKDAAGNNANEISKTGNLTFSISAVSGAVQNTKKYYVYLQDPGKCFPPVVDSVSVTLYDMSVSISGTQTKLCRSLLDPNPVTDLTANFTGSAPNGLEFKWTNLTTGDSVGNNKDLGSVNSRGTYEVEVRNLATSCVRKASKDIQLINAAEFPVATILPGGVCNSTPINLKASFIGGASAKDSVTYTWKVLNGLNTISFKDSSAVYVPAVADTNSLVFKVYTSNRCDSGSAEVNSAKLKPGPIAKIYANPLESRTGKDITFTNGTLNSDSVNVISFEDGFTNTWGAGSGQSLTHVYFKEGKFKTKLYTVNKNGCESKDSVIVTILDNQKIFVPNVFSPNASQVENQTFRIFGQTLSPQDFNMIVYNRWGHVVFVTTDLNKAMFVGWDGKEGGADAQMGVYTYAIQAKFLDGTDFEKTGTVTLLR